MLAARACGEYVEVARLEHVDLADRVDVREGAAQHEGHDDEIVVRVHVVPGAIAREDLVAEDPDLAKAGAAGLIFVEIEAGAPRDRAVGMAGHVVGVPPVDGIRWYPRSWLRRMKEFGAPALAFTRSTESRPSRTGTSSCRNPGSTSRRGCRPTVCRAEGSPPGDRGPRRRGSHSRCTCISCTGVCPGRLCEALLPLLTLDLRARLVPVVEELLEADVGQRVLHQRLEHAERHGAHVSPRLGGVHDVERVADRGRQHL